MAEHPPESYYHWPTLRSKLLPITIIRVPMMWPWFPCRRVRQLVSRQLLGPHHRPLDYLGRSSAYTGA